MEMKILRYYLSKSEMTRRGEVIERVEKIVIYKVKSSKDALQYRLYIESLKRQEDIYFSVHYIIDSKGDVINIVPEKEVSIHDENNLEMNYVTISILLLEEEGKIATFALKKLLADKIKKYQLNINQDVIIKDTNQLN